MRIKGWHLLTAVVVLGVLWMFARGGPAPEPWNMHASYQPGGLYGGGQ
jgi:hypothetical protein